MVTVAGGGAIEVGRGGGGGSSLLTKSHKLIFNAMFVKKNWHSMKT